jgi:hypothetical protein
MISELNPSPPCIYTSEHGPSFLVYFWNDSSQTISGDAGMVNADKWVFAFWELSLLVGFTSRLGPRSDEPLG